MSRVLVLTTDTPPLPGLVPSGAGMRAWGLTFGLRSVGAEVTLGFAADSIRGIDMQMLPPIPGVLPFERAQLRSFIQQQKPDCVVFQHWGLFSELKEDIDLPIAIDLAGPHLLERQFWGSAKPEQDRWEKLRALRRADFLVCSGEYQRRYFLSFLLEAGHSGVGPLCPVIPFSLSPELPERIAPKGEISFVYAGTFLPWQNPTVAIESLLEVMDKKEKGRLIFVGGIHGGGDVSRGRFDALLERLQQHERVEILGPQPFEKLVGILRQAHVAIDAMEQNAERELAFPTRTMTYLWAGVPVVHHDYDELAPIIEQAKAGWILSPADPKAFEAVYTKILSSRSESMKRGSAAQKLIREHYGWDRTITPLAAWVAAPTRRQGSTLVGLEPAGSTSTDLTVTKKKKRTQLRQKSKRNPWYLSPWVFVLVAPVSAILALTLLVTDLIRTVLFPRPKVNGRYTSARNKRGNRRS